MLKLERPMGVPERLTIALSAAGSNALSLHNLLTVYGFLLFGFAGRGYCVLSGNLDRACFMGWVMASRSARAEGFGPIVAR